MTWGFSRDDVEASFFSELPRAGHLRRSRRSSRSTSRASARWSARPPSEGRATRARPAPRASAASTAATRTRSTSSTRSAWTTSPARRSGCRWPGSRPPARRWAPGWPPRPEPSPGTRSDGCQKSADARFARPLSTRGSSLPTAREEPEQVLAGPVPVVAGACAGPGRPAGRTRRRRGRRAGPGRPPGSARPRRRGRAAAAARAALTSTPDVRWSTLAIASPAAASSVGRVGVDELLVLRDRPVDVTLAERVLRRGVPRVDRRLALLGRHGARPCRGWCRPVIPCAVSCCITWVSAVRSSSIGHDVLQQRHRPAVEDDHDQRDRRDLHRLGDARCGVDVDQTGQEPARRTPSPASRCRRPARRSRASGCARRRPAAPVPSSTTRGPAGSSAR